jgi:hypothetical protein
MGRIENVDRAESGGKLLQSIIFHSRLIVAWGLALMGGPNLQL